MSRSNRFRGPSPLSESASGQVSMPFVPTLAFVAILGAASFLCSSPQTDAPVRMDVETTASIAPAPSFAPRVASTEPRRMTATLAFAEAYPLTVMRVGTAAAEPRTAVPRTTARLAAARRVCPGRHCPDPVSTGATAAAPVPDPFASIRTAAESVRASEPSVVPMPPRRALPFVETVAEVVEPTARVVGTAADYVREGAANVSGAVSGAVSDAVVGAVTGTLSGSATLMAECLR